VAFDPSTAVKAKKPNPATNVGYVDQNGNPFSGTSTPVAGGFAPVVTPKAANDYNTPTFGTVPGPYDALRASLKAQNPGIPASFIDDEVDNLNSGRTRQKNGASGANPNDINGVSTIIQTEWRSETDRARYQKTDADAAASQKQGDIIAGATTANNKITATQQQAQGTNWATNVQPALNASTAAVGNQQTVDAAQQKRIDDATSVYNDTIAGNQAARMSDIGSTNSYLTGLANDYQGYTTGINNSNSQFASQFLPTATNANNANSDLVSSLFGATNSTNAANSQLGQQISQAASSANANQTGLFNTLSGQAAGINSNQTGLYNTLAGQASGINNNQTQLFNDLSSQAAMSNSQLNAANSQFQGQLSDLNSQQEASRVALHGQLTDLSNAQSDSDMRLRQQLQEQSLEASNNASQFGSQIGGLSDEQTRNNTYYQGQLSELNGLDRDSLTRYMSETDPLMAAQVAQGSDPQDVANMQDVVGKYKELSNPQVTAQERLVAELARRKFEGDDQSNREALMQQLKGRGLQSGGLTIAGLQSANQQTSNDRQLAEMGLNANAQQRAMQGMAGYADSSSALRNADDAMRNFQDQYAQNDAVRRGNLSGQRQAANLATNAQIGDRDTAGFNANTTTTNNNTQRAGMVFDANRNTLNDNTNRSGMAFDADTATYNANTQRAGMGFDADTASYNANTNRDALGFDATRNTVNDNYNRDQSVFNAGTTTNEDNFTRDQGVFNAGTTTNEDNFTRDQGVFNAGTQTNQDNYFRTSNAATLNEGFNQDNLGNTQFATTTATGVNNDNAARTRTALQDNIGTNQTNLLNQSGATGLLGTTAIGNSSRTQGGLDKGDTTASSTLDSIGKAATNAQSNAAGETSSAQGNASTQTAGATTFNNLGQTSADQQKADVDKWLELNGLNMATKAV
jgi:hypothetical protein